MVMDFALADVGLRNHALLLDLFWDLHLGPDLLYPFVDFKSSQIWMMVLFNHQCWTTILADSHTTPHLRIRSNNG